MKKQNKVDVVEAGQKIDVAKKTTADLIAVKHDQPPKVDKKNHVVKHEQATEKKAPKFSDDQLLAALKTVGHPATSREVSDALHIENADYGRNMIRTRMAELAKAGKVKITPAPKDTRFKKLYVVA